MKKQERTYHLLGNNDNYYERAEKILNELQTKKDNGDFNGLTAYEEAVNLGFEGTKEEWLASLKGEYDDTEIKKEISNLQTNYYKVVTNEVIERETEFELPFNYVVGTKSFEIFYNSERLIREDSEEQKANYREVGESGQVSNKIMFGWDIQAGETLDFIVKGEVVDDD